ncbi:50S ribosomal protein L33 [Candidatus Campbellbacteria bacterium CG22_combo_CG10-13_8_21_14_all_36_13]|uniref:Large ribosomal subunit protein bL33 n=1 Tax=Candidatus Campbellbacteria bacterium CG22_combo_CG10-13_8_21_14_all_36_13 TaxID=1974529 RepID=A0A2H0DZL7_9BACT|nr:MAG: 50S ribosomal protein L33 [Candidatus Campbellbacteria bacterium CG22_combo_CG10-13_8_21_14_all_36_13]
MAQKTLIILQNSDTRETYYTRRNKKGENADKKIELKKYSPKLKKHVVFKEVKKLSKKKKAVVSTKKKSKEQGV